MVGRNTKKNRTELKKKKIEQEFVLFIRQLMIKKKAEKYPNNTEIVGNCNTSIIRHYIPFGNERSAKNNGGNEKKNGGKIKIGIKYLCFHPRHTFETILPSCSNNF